uniref:Uncharacterized protein n=1 Tax=Molossus molossus TaxID=27622 RepID=A0A7J8BJP5_MOLMO|nr:hypothetical protein HJG59_010228 [Molossus molossus]
MGQGPSGSGTPLQCLLNNFSDFSKRLRLQHLSRPWILAHFVRIAVAHFLDQLALPIDLSSLFAVRGVIYGTPGHPDRTPYTDVWIDIATDKPNYIKKCSCPNREKIVMAQPPRKPQKPSAPAPSQRLYPVLPGPLEDPLTDPVGHPLIGLRHLLLPFSRSVLPIDVAAPLLTPPQAPDSSAALLPLRQVAPPPGGDQTPWALHGLCPLLN